MGRIEVEETIASLLIEVLPLSTSSLALFEVFAKEAFSFFLDSSMLLKNVTRYSFMGYEPFLIFKSKGKKIEILDIKNQRKKGLEGNPFFELRKLYKEYNVFSSSSFPFVGGVVGYFGYGLCHFIEELPRQAKDDLEIPDCVFGFYDAGIVIDHWKKRIYLVSTGLPEKGDKGYERAKKKLEELKQVVKLAEERGVSYFKSGKKNVFLKSNFTKKGYKEAVNQVREYIISGDVFQINLSQRFKTLPHPSFDLYKRLRQINPSPFACYLNFDEVKIMSASPERFLRLSESVAQTRPIKGTRPRGETTKEDRQLAFELLASVKDKAEHVMIVDLERNDLGRVCEYGSVWVPELAALEVFPTVFHLTSTIEGKLRKDKDVFDLLMAGFPGGSITGAPKVRAMEIIDELEPTVRGIYTGSIGYLSFNGNMDLNIVIRTFFEAGDALYFNVGGGVVFDSDPQAEYQETLDKAKALIQTLEL